WNGQGDSDLRSYAGKDETARHSRVAFVVVTQHGRRIRIVQHVDDGIATQRSIQLTLVRRRFQSQTTRPVPVRCEVLGYLAVDGADAIQKKAILHGGREIYDGYLHG